MEISYIIADYSGCQPCYVKHVDTLERFVTWTEDLDSALTFPTGFHAKAFIDEEVRKCGYFCCRVLEVYDDDIY